jgi:hypothetical protein
MSVPEELYLVKLQELVDEAVGVVPWAREIAREVVGWARPAADRPTELAKLIGTSAPLDLAPKVNSVCGGRQEGQSNRLPGRAASSSPGLS